MDNMKNSFVIYLDAYPHVLTLTKEEQGDLFTSLFWYANNAARREHPMDITMAATQCQSLTPRARMAFSFMASAIARDTEKWNEKRRNYLRSAANREAKKRPAPMPFRGRGVDVYPSDEEAKQLGED